MSMFDLWVFLQIQNQWFSSDHHGWLVDSPASDHDIRLIANEGIPMLILFHMHKNWLENIYIYIEYENIL